VVVAGVGFEPTTFRL